MRVYLADLAAYNSGHLHGVWIDASSDLEDMEEQAQTMIEASPAYNAEEYEVHDTDDLPSYVRTLKDVSDYMETIEDVSRELFGAPHINNKGRHYQYALDEAAQIVKAYKEHFGPYKVSGSDIADKFCGFWDKEQAFADEQADQMLEQATAALINSASGRAAGALLQELISYFDHEAYCRTLFCSDYVYEAGIVFSTR